MTEDKQDSTDDARKLADLKSRLLARMTEKGWGPADLARQSGVPEASCRIYVNPQNTQGMGADNLRKLAVALDANLHWLVFGTMNGATEDAMGQWAEVRRVSVSGPAESLAQRVVEHYESVEDEREREEFAVRLQEWLSHYNSPLRAIVRQVGAYYDSLESPDEQKALRDSLDGWLIDYKAQKLRRRKGG